MLIQKVFHLRQPLDEAQARLAKFQNLSDRPLNMGEVALVEDGRRHWDAMSLLGRQGPCQFELLPTDNKHQVLFHSKGGEMEVCGLMELLPVRDHLTEVQLTLEYEIQSPLRRALDRLLGVMNRRVNRQILDMKRQMDDDGGPKAQARFVPSRFIPRPLAGLVGKLHPAR